MLGAPNEGEEESWELVHADGTTSGSHDPWILLGRRDRKVAAFVTEEAGANDAGTTAQPHPAESRHEPASAPPPRRSAVSALAALCGRPRGVMAPRNGRAVSPLGSAAKKKHRQRKLRPFGRPKSAGRLRQLYP